MANYEEEVCEDCMYFGKEACEDPRVDKKHQACRWFKRK